MKASQKAVLLAPAGVACAGMIFFHSANAASPAGHAVVLQYHHFGEDTPPSTSVTPDQFARHLEYLEKNEYVVWPLERIIEHLQHGKPLPEKCVAITVDDAYTSVYQKAFPMLAKRSLPFTVFVPTEGVDRGYGSYMTWPQMREMQSTGASFSSHSHRHDSLIVRQRGESEAEWSDRITRDITHSLKRLKEELGSGSNLFAYPYGEYDNALKRIIVDLRLVGIGQHSGAVWAGSDFGALPRFPMAAGYAGMEQFSEKVRSLPLPVLSAEPADPVLPPEVSRPVLRLKLAPEHYRSESLACYADGQGRIETKWTDFEQRTVEVAAGRPLPAGRSRYNCTARHNREGRYYWYSHLWIRNIVP